jgi:hypothetical protein
MSYFMILKLIKYKFEIWVVWYAYCFTEAKDYELAIKNRMMFLFVIPLKAKFKHYYVVACNADCCPHGNGSFLRSC